MPLPRITLTGSPYAQGQQHGQQLRQRIEHNLAVYFHRFTAEIGLTRNEVLRRARLYADAIAEQNEAYYEGMRGVADGAGLSLAEIAAINVRYEILYFQRGQNLQSQATDGCTSFAIHPSRTANGHLIMGENWDWIPEIQGAILHTTDADGMETLAFTEAGIVGAKIGMNSAEIGLSVNGLNSIGDDWATLRKPFHVRCFEILRQRDFEAAVAVITDEPRACSGNFMIAQAPDKAADIEAAANVYNRIGWENGIISHANDFVDLSIPIPNNPRLATSCARRERMSELLNAQPTHSVEDIQTILRDRHMAPHSLCRLPDDPTRGPNETSQTVTGAIIDLDARKLWFSDGPPVENEFESFTF